MNRKRIIYGDIHGRIDCVKAIYEREQPDDVIMLGDYCDSHNNLSPMDIRKCWDDIVDLYWKHKELKRNEFIMLVGNHDFHYIDEHEEYSGYNSSTWLAMHVDLQRSLENGLLRIGYVDNVNKILYTHAGVTKTWLNEVAEIEDINDINNINWKSLRFNYYGGFSQTGNQIYSSCIWVRPNALSSDLFDPDWTQIVGHTRTISQKILGFYDKDIVEDLNDAQIVLCDSLPFQYLVEEFDENGKFIKRYVKDYEEIQL